MFVYYTLEKAQSLEFFTALAKQYGQIQARIRIVLFHFEDLPELALRGVVITFHVGDDSIKYHHVDICWKLLDRL